MLASASVLATASTPKVVDSSGDDSALGMTRGAIGELISTSVAVEDSDTPGPAVRLLKGRSAPTLGAARSSPPPRFEDVFTSPPPPVGWFCQYETSSHPLPGVSAWYCHSA